MVTRPPLIRIEDLFADPVMSGATVSPEGTRIAFLAPHNGRKQVWIRNVDPTGGLAGDAVCVTDERERGITRYHWTDDPRWLLYEMDSGGDEAWHVYRVDLENPGSPPVDLTPMGPGSRVFKVHRPKAMPGRFVAVMNWPRVHLVDVQVVDVATGELTLLAENPGNVAGWLPNDEGGLLLQVENTDHDYQFGVWDADIQAPRIFATYPGEDYPLGILPSEATPDGTGVWIGSYGDGDDLRVVHLDIATGEETVVDTEPGHDLDTSGLIAQAGFSGSPLIRSAATGELLAARYVGDRQIIRIIDPAFAEIFETLAALHDGHLGPVSSDSSGQRWVATFVHDTDPHVTYFYDHTTGKSELLYRPYPQLEPDQLAPMTPVTIPARDGLELPCHLTLPVGVEPSHLPMVLTVHGGPWYRDSWGYNPHVQFFANRGYAVLQVNFRGSLGYGRAHTKSAMREFAGTMHDDLIDAVEWAIEQGYADRDRVAIYGGSYGGYAALVGATFTPEVFACAIDYVGISDLVNFQATASPFVRDLLYNSWGRYVGDPDIPEDEADMLARSPITRIDQLTIPLMVVQGANDPRVVKEESDNIVAGLRARGVEVAYMVKDDEGHGFENPENVMDMFRAMESFLAQHIGGRSAPTG